MELPEIEPDAEITLNCGNTEFDDARRQKAPEMTCGYAKGVDDINTQSAMVGGSFGDDAMCPRRGQSHVHQPSAFPNLLSLPLTRCTCGRFRAFQELPIRSMEKISSDRSTESPRSPARESSWLRTI